MNTGFICKYGHIETMNGREYLECDIVNSGCPYIRFCANDMCIKMTNGSNDCKYKNIKEYSQNIL